MKQDKASRVDVIPTELLKNVGKDTQRKLFEMIGNMYRDGNFPKDQNCTNPLEKKFYRMQELQNNKSLNICFQILLNIIKNRIKTKVEEKPGEDNSVIDNKIVQEKQF